jgi:hypothetical protein
MGELKSAQSAQSAREKKHKHQWNSRDLWEFFLTTTGTKVLNT